MKPISSRPPGGFDVFGLELMSVDAESRCSCSRMPATNAHECTLMHKDTQTLRREQNTNTHRTMRGHPSSLIHAHTLLKHTRALTDTFSVEDKPLRGLDSRSHTYWGIASELDVRRLRVHTECEEEQYVRDASVPDSESMRGHMVTMRASERDVRAQTYAHVTCRIVTACPHVLHAYKRSNHT